MKQISIFDSNEPQGTAWKLYTDGGARNNPGPAGAGIYILKDNQSFIQEGYFLGNLTNNQAEYSALLLGLLNVKRYMQPNDTLIIKLDSELLVKQIKGIYSVKNKDLLKLYTQVKSLLKDTAYSIYHVPREQNTVADKLANKGIDKKIPIPTDLLQLMVKL